MYASLRRRWCGAQDLGLGGVRLGTGYPADPDTKAWLKANVCQVGAAGALGAKRGGGVCGCVPASVADRGCLCVQGAGRDATHPPSHPPTQLLFIYGWKSRRPRVRA